MVESPQQANEVKWFLHESGQVKGPFLTDQLKELIDRMDNRLQENSFVWRRGYQEWMRVSKWKPSDGLVAAHVQANTVSQTSNSDLTTEMNTATQVTKIAPTKNSQASTSQTSTESSMFRIQINFVDQPLMSKADLLNLLSKQKDISTIAIQDPKSKEWKEVYAFPDLVERLGLSRRQHPRVPILAQFTGKTSRHQNFNSRIITISEGGIGFTDVFDLKIGDEVEGQVSSPHFFQPVNMRAEVVYSGLDGFIGLKFTQINEESQAAIIDYIKKFGRASPAE